MTAEFPPSFPSDEVGTLVQKIRHPASVTNRDAIKAGWWVVGYGMGQLIPGEFGTAAALTAEDVAKALGDPRAAASATAIPWQLILPVVLDLLKTWLSKGS